MRPADVRALSWLELDSVQHGYQARQQHGMVGFRELLTQNYNINRAAKSPAVSARILMPLPAVDPPPPRVPVKVNGETADEYRARVSAETQRKLDARQTAAS